MESELELRKRLDDLDRELKEVKVKKLPQFGKNPKFPDLLPNSIISWVLPLDCTTAP